MVVDFCFFPATGLSLLIRKKLLRAFPRSGMLDARLEGYYKLLRMTQISAKCLSDFPRVVEIGVIISEVVGGDSRRPSVVCPRFS